MIHGQTGNGGVAGPDWFLFRQASPNDRITVTRSGYVMRSTFDEASGFATRIRIEEASAHTLDLWVDAPPPR